MAIKIVYYTETIDNWGRSESSMKGNIIFDVLNNVEDWNDDMNFQTKGGAWFTIDELAGKEVDVPEIGIFKVPEDPEN
jgi:hypothetical protein